MSGNMLLTARDQEECYISEMLGNLEGKKYKYKHGPEGWGAWPTRYLQAQITFARAKLALQQRQFYESQKGQKIDKAAMLPVAEAAKVKEQAKATTNAMAEFLKKKS